MKNSSNTLLIILLSLSLNIYARQQPLQSQKIAGIDTMLLKLEAAISEAHMPGLMIAISNKNGTIYSGGVGYANIKKKMKVDSRTMFRFASVTKMFTALAIEKLISDGYFSLNDDLKKIAPEIPFENPFEKASPLRVIHLLEHTSGFEDVQLGRMITSGHMRLNGLSALDFHKSSLRARWKPGERMSYSNPGYEVLGYLIEKFSGMSVKKYIESNIIFPMGLKNTLITEGNSGINNLALAYHYTGNGYSILPTYTQASNGASGNLVSCAEDMGIYLTSILNYHQTTIPIGISKAAVADMDRIHSSLASKRGLQTGYAIGNVNLPNGQKITFRGHNGLGEGFNSWVFYNRQNGIAYAIANNSGENNWRISQIIESFITKNIHHNPPKESREKIGRFQNFVGYYVFANPKNERWDFIQKIFKGINLHLSANQVIIENTNGQIDTLIHVEKNLFRLRNEILPSFVISYDDQGKPFIQGYPNSLFFTKSEKAPILVQQYIFYLGFVSMAISLVFMMVSLILLILKKINLNKFSLLCMPGIATLSGLLAYRKLVLTDEINKIAFASVNSTTLFIFFASLGFGVFTILSLVQLIWKWNTLTNKFLKGILVFIILMLCYLTGIFLINGWIGTRIWTQ